MMKFIVSVSMLILVIKISSMVFCMNMMFILSLFLMFKYISGGAYWEVGSGFCLSEVSFLLILLSVWVVGLMIMCLVQENNSWDSSLKLFMALVMLLILFMFFSSMNLLMFYLFFEVSLIPTFFMVYYWGNNLERFKASFYLIMYMLFISLPLLIYLIKMNDFNFSLDMSLLSMLSMNKMSVVVGVWDFMIIFGAFFIKLPIYLYHVWLPKAHVEAPVWGSMLLAAILLKLGGYGVLRLIYMFIFQCWKYSSMVISISILGALYSGVLCLVQVDLKSLVAYSSVVHMNLMLSGIFTLMKLSVFSAVVVMISHGLCSSGLFYLVNVFYQRTGSRLLVLNKGYILKFSSMMIWWFLLCSANFSFPFSLNFIGEIGLMMILLGWCKSVMIFLMLICFFSGAYSLYLYSMVCHSGGEVSGGEEVNFDLFIEHLSSFLHFVPLLLGMLNLNLFMN